MAVVAAEILDEWRSAERLLEALPDDAPERSEVERVVAEMRTLYLRLTDGAFPSSRDRLEDARGRIDRARMLLRSTWTRIESQHR